MCLPVTSEHSSPPPSTEAGAIVGLGAFGAASYDKSRPDGRLVDRVIGSGDENL
jgi:hypothetical protein